MSRESGERVEFRGTLRERVCGVLAQVIDAQLKHAWEFGPEEMVSGLREAHTIIVRPRDWAAILSEKELEK